MSHRRARLTDCLDRVVRAVYELCPPDATEPTLTVERKYTQEYLDPALWRDNPDLATTFTGRRIYVFGMEASQVEAASRAQDRNEYRVTVAVLERYEAQRDVGDDAARDEWVDDRVAWVEDVVYDRLGEARTRTDRPRAPALQSGGYVPATKEWVKVYDYDLLRTQGLFMSAVVIAFHKWE
jgi:hypothetical protein